jgi:hypothetical protein
MVETTTPAPTVLTFFTKLPIELRLKIWGLALPKEGRIIEIRWNEDTNLYFTYSSPPAALHACHEFRQLALKKYEVLEFQNDVDADTYEAGVYEQSIGGQTEGSGYNSGGDVKHESNDGSQVQSNGDIEGENGVAEAEGKMSTSINVDGENAAQDDSVVKFRTYIDYTLDAPYFAGAHLCKQEHFDGGDEVKRAPALDRLLWQLSDLEDISAKIRFIALEARSANSYVLASRLFELENLQRITLVYGDDCCRADERGNDSCFRKARF